MKNFALLNDDDGDDPLASLVNLIDVFLVLVAAALLALAQSPASLLGPGDMTVIRNPSSPNMEVLVKKGQKIERFQADGQKAVGSGARAGVAYRMSDGSLVYVPE